MDTPATETLPTASDILRSFDARDWARTFLLIVAEKPDLPLDEGAMMGWFANALMRGYDEHARRQAEHSTPSEAVTVVDSLVEDYLLSPAYRNRGTCAGCLSWVKAEMMPTLCLLPSVAQPEGAIDWPGVVDYQRVGQVVCEFECYKLGGRCNRWTPWMRQRLRDTKIPAPQGTDARQCGLCGGPATLKLTGKAFWVCAQCLDRDGE